VGAAFKHELAVALAQQEGQHGLTDERGAAGAADGEGVVAGADGAGLEVERAAAQLGAIDLGATDGSGALYGGEVLAQQARLGAAGADVVDAQRPPGEGGEGEGGAQDLAAAFALGAVDGDEVVHGGLLGFWGGG
jgi:hypothetical protein